MRLLGHLLLLIALALASAWCAGWHWACCCGDGCTSCLDCATNCNDNESITLDISIVSYDGTECDCASGANGTLAKSASEDCQWGYGQVGSSYWFATVYCNEIGGLYRWAVYLEYGCPPGGVDCAIWSTFELCEVDCSDGHPAGGPWRLDFGGTNNVSVDLTIT